MAEFLPRICDSICGNEQYVCKVGAFILNTFGTKGFARLYLEKQYSSLRVADLQYLREMFHVVQNQLNVYTLCLPDVLSYVTAALTSANYVQPALNASRHILFPHLYEELKTLFNTLHITLFN